jgi:hypothetical protein
MRRRLAIPLALWLAATGRMAFADELRTDINIVTGLDVSGSIDAKETQVQIEGLAQALRSPAVIAAIGNGQFRRVGFAVFIWATDHMPVFQSWRVISSEADAVAMSVEISTRVPEILRSNAALKLGELTDLSGAMTYGAAMLHSAPFPTNRSVLNILGNGLDNVGEGPGLTRDLVVASGVTINAVVIGTDQGIFRYFRGEVIGGPSAFVFIARDADTIAEVFERKFVTEIVLNLPPEGAPHERQ